MPSQEKDADNPSVDELRRLQALKRFEILDTPPDGNFDNLTRIMVRLFDVPIAIVSLVDKDRIWFKAAEGLDATEIDREPGLCASAIMADTPYVVENAALDPRCLTNPLVAGEFGLSFYAAAPLITKDGFRLGTVCCLDFKPRSWSNEQSVQLQAFSDIVMGEMELRLAARDVDKQARQIARLNTQLAFQASHDDLTGLLNRRAVHAELASNLNKSREGTASFSLLLFDIDRFKSINDTWGHPVGDQVLRQVCERLQHCLQDADVIGRTGGEEFMAVLPSADQQRAASAAEACRRVIAAEPYTVTNGDRTVDLDVTLSIGLVTIRPTDSIEQTQIIQAADEAMYYAKQSGRNTVARYDLDRRQTHLVTVDDEWAPSLRKVG